MQTTEQPDAQPTSEQTKQAPAQDPLYNDPKNNDLLTWTNDVVWSSFGWAFVGAVSTAIVKKLLK